MTVTAQLRSHDSQSEKEKVGEVQLMERQLIAHLLTKGEKMRQKIELFQRTINSNH